MITTVGQGEILERIVSGQAIAQSVAFGIGSTSEDAGDERIEFEIHRSDVDLIETDGSSVLVRARIPDQKYFEVHEIGLLGDSSGAGVETPSHVITLFDESADTWTGFSAIETDGIRSGTGAFRVDDSDTLDSVETAINLASLQANDEFAIAYNRLSGTQDFSVRFVQDGSNYYDLPVATAGGFNVHRFKLSDMATVGSPDLDGADKIQIVVTGTGSTLFEGMRLDNQPIDDSLLIARKVLSPAIQKSGSVELQVEYNLGVTFA